MIRWKDGIIPDHLSLIHNQRDPLQQHRPIHLERREPQRPRKIIRLVAHDRIQQSQSGRHLGLIRSRLRVQRKDAYTARVFRS